MKKIIVMFMILSMLFGAVEISSMNAKAEERKYIDLNAGESYEVNVGDEVCFRIFPRETGLYRIYSVSDNQANKWAVIYDEEYDELDSSGTYNGEEVTDFSITCSLDEGCEYYLETGLLEERGTYQVYMEKVPEVTKIELLSGEIQLVENLDGYAWGEFGENYFYHVELDKCNILTKIIYEDGTSEITKPNGGWWTVHTEQQYSSPWVKGGEQYVDLEYRGQYVSIPVEIIENPIQSVSFNKKPQATYYINELYYDSYEEAFVLQTTLDGIELLVEYKDGTSEIYTEEELEEFEQNILVSGPGTYETYYQYMGFKLDYEIFVVAPRITSKLTEESTCLVDDNLKDAWFELQPMNSGLYTFSTVGIQEGCFIILYDEKYVRCMGEGESDTGDACYITSLEAGKKYYLKVRAWDTMSYVVQMKYHNTKLSDETIYHIDNSSNITLFEFAPNRTDEYCLEIKNDKADGYIDVEIFEVDAESGDLYRIAWENRVYDTKIYEKMYDSSIYYIIFKPSFTSPISCDVCIRQGTDVAKLEWISGEIGPFVENIGGQWDENFDEETIYVYDYYDDLYNLEFRITYEDGSYIETPYVYEMYGIRFRAEDNQYQDVWTIGKKNNVTIHYGGQYVNIPVSIIENPIEEIGFLKAPRATAICKYDEEWDELELVQNKLEELELSVTYKNGITELYTEKDLKDNKLQGYNYKYYVTEDVTGAGTYNAVFEWLGFKEEFKVEVIEDPIESIYLIKESSNSGICMPDLIGMKIGIRYKDGTEKVVTISNNNSIYNYEKSYGVSIVDNNIELEIDVYKQYEEGDANIECKKYHYVYDIYRANFKGGIICTLQGIQQYSDKDICSLKASNVSLDVVGMVFDIIYEDGTTSQLTVSEANQNSWDTNDFVGAIRTEQGVIRCAIDGYDRDRDGNIDAYIIEAFGKTIFANATRTCLHEIVENIPAKGATCTETGYTAGTKCSDCGTMVSGCIEVNALGHSYDDGKISKTATQKETGIMTFTCNSCGYTKKIVIPKVSRPEKSSVIKVIRGKKKITIKYKKVSGVDGYQIRVATKKNMKKGRKLYNVKSSKSKYVVKNLKANKKYWIQIRTLKKVNGEKVYSKWSSKKTIKTKK